MCFQDWDSVFQQIKQSDFVASQNNAAEKAQKFNKKQINS